MASCLKGALLPLLFLNLALSTTHQARNDALLASFREDMSLSLSGSLAGKVQMTDSTGKRYDCADEDAGAPVVLAPEERYVCVRGACVYVAGAFAFQEAVCVFAAWLEHGHSFAPRASSATRCGSCPTALACAVVSYIRPHDTTRGLLAVTTNGRDASVTHHHYYYVSSGRKTLRIIPSVCASWCDACTLTLTHTLVRAPLPFFA